MNLIIASFIGAALFTVVILYLRYGLKQGLNALLVANRQMPYWLVGFWMATAFTWGTTFFFVSQLSYQNGLAGVLFFIVGNTGGLAIAMILAMNIPQPGQRYSLSAVMSERYDKKTGMLYALTVVGAQGAYSLTLQFIVAATLFELVLGVDRNITIIAAASTMLVPALIGGMRSSAVIDTLDASMMTMLIVLVPFAVYAAGGVGEVMVGISGVQALQSGSSIDKTFVLTLGIPLIISLVTAGPIDQSLFQRFFSVRQGPRSTMRTALVAGLVFFVLNMAAGAVLGFLAANQGLGIEVANARIAGFATIEELVPVATTLLIVLILASVASSGDGALNASSSVWAIDVYKRGRPIPEERVKFVQRATMVFFIVLAAGIALSGVDMLSFVIAIGVLSSSLFVPVVVGLLVDEKHVPRIFGAIVVSIPISTILYGTGQVCQSMSCPALPFASAEWYSLAGSMSGLIITGLWCLWSAYAQKTVTRFA